VRVRVLLQLPRPTPTLFPFPPSEPAVNAAPSLSVHSPGGTGISVSPALTPPPSGSHQPSPQSPSRGYCPVVRGLAPSNAVSGGLGVPAATSAVRSPSVNRLGSLFNSINRSVTSAFSGFVAVNQPVPGVIQDDGDHPGVPAPPALQRQQSQPRFKPPSRRGSSQESAATDATAPSLPQTSVAVPGPPATPERAGVRQLRAAEDEGCEASARPPRAPVGAPAGARRPRPRVGLPMLDIADPTPPYTNQHGHRNFVQRGSTQYTPVFK